MKAKLKISSAAISVAILISLISIFAIPVAAQGPEITLTPDSGPAGAEVAVEGSGFTPWGYVTIYFDMDGDEYVDGSDELLAWGLADEYGDMSATLVVPLVPVGDYDVCGLDWNVWWYYGEWWATDPVTFTVEFGTTVHPDRGPVGAEVAVIGSGFTAGGIVYTYFDMDGDDDLEDEELVAETTADENGAMFTTFVVPLVPMGDYNVYSYDMETGTITDLATFTVGPTISLCPSSGFATTAIAGIGFTPGSVVTIQWEDIAMPTVPTTVIVEGDGDFTAMVSIPTATLGGYTITATDGEGLSAEAVFTVVGITGLQGPQGEKGETGPQGPPGEPAPTVEFWASLAVAIIAILIAAYTLIMQKRAQTPAQLKRG